MGCRLGMDRKDAVTHRRSCAVWSFHLERVREKPFASGLQSAHDTHVSSLGVFLASYLFWSKRRRIPEPIDESHSSLTCGRLSWARGLEPVLACFVVELGHFLAY
mmetsp:Transcript_3329/g.8457  ORF Transcript_3329/g.8457 Transcript_3329/m.8457 type:complete len:105 (+) Transcript_3329:245-559(+)